MPDARQNGNFLRQNKTQKQHNHTTHKQQLHAIVDCGLKLETAMNNNEQQ